MGSNGWVETTWGDIATLEYGKALRDYKNGNGSIPVYGTNGQIGYTVKALCKSEGVIIGRKGAYRGVHYSSKPFYVIDTAFYLKQKNEKEFYNKWAYYELLIQNINSMDSGSAIPSTSRADFYALPVNLPPLTEQKVIADTLSCLDDKIELNNKINKTLEELAQAIFKSWFVDFEPFRDGEFEDSELGRIPKGWRIEKLSYVVTVKDGTHDSPKSKEYGYPLVTSKHLKSYDIEFNETYFIDEEDYLKINKRSKVEKHDILISMIGTVGNICYVLYDNIAFAIKNIGLVKTSSKKDLAEYLLFYLKSESMKEYIASRLAGSTQKYISLTELRKIPVIMPPKDILSNFKNIMVTILDNIYTNTQENQILITIRDSLLPKLMSGEIRVPIEEVQ